MSGIFSISPMTIKNPWKIWFFFIASGVCQASCPILIKKIFIPFFLYKVINNKIKLLTFLELFIMSFPLSPVAYATGERGNDIKV